MTAYAALGQYSQAADAIEKAILLDKKPIKLQRLAEVYARWGNRQKALQLVAESRQMSKPGDVDSTEIALIYAQLGDKNDAFTWLMKAKPEYDPRMSDPGFDSIRTDPRFQVIQERYRPNPDCPAF